jgi:hypothetical protein
MVFFCCLLCYKNLLLLEDSRHAYMILGFTKHVWGGKHNYFYFDVPIWFLIIHDHYYSTRRVISKSYIYIYIL